MHRYSTTTTLVVARVLASSSTRRALESWRIQEEKRNDLSLGHDDLSPRSLAMRGESDDLSDFGSSTEKEQGQKDSSDSVGGELEDAIVALENMALGKPDRARSWISLSKARSHA